MRDYMKCLGLEHLVESEDTAYGFISYILENGKPIIGYSNEPYLNHALGYAEFIARVRLNEEKQQYEFTGMDVHCSGSCNWDLRIVDDISPKDWEITRRRLLCNTETDRDGLFVINVVNADVLPSFLQDDRIHLQLIAFPLFLELYENEDSLWNAQTAENALGKKLLPGEGSLIPIGFMSNHQVGNGPEKEEADSDDVMMIRGKIKWLGLGKVNIQDEEFNGFIDCIIETMYGDLEVVFTYDQVPESQRGLLKPGMILIGTFVLSGDAAVKEYSNGIVMDERHHLALLRHTFLRGETERLQSVLSDQVSYSSQSSGKQIQGKEEITAHLSKIHQATKGKYHGYFASVLKSAHEPSTEQGNFPVGTSCIVLALDEPENYVSIAFILLDNDAKIKHIHIAAYEQYQVEFDELPPRKNKLADFGLPETAGEAMVLRAKFHGMIHDETTKEDVYRQIRQNSFLKYTADLVVDSLKTSGTDLSRSTLENVFAFVFAKSALMIERGKDWCEPEFIIHSEISKDMSASRLVPTSLDDSKKAKFSAAVEFAKQFQMDFYNIKGDLNLDDLESCSAFREALVVVLQLGIMFASNHL